MHRPASRALRHPVRTEIATPFTSHVHTPAPTGLRGHAQVEASLSAGKAAPPAGRSPAGRAVDRVRGWLGLSTDVDWLRTTLRHLRAETVGAPAPHAEPQGAGAPRRSLRALDGPHPVTAFWRQAEPTRVRGRADPAVFARFDALALRTSAPLALAASMACLRATDAFPEAAEALDDALFDCLRAPGLLARIAAFEPTPGADASLRMAIEVLTHCARTAAFEALVHGLTGSPLASDQVAPLRRLLSATAVASAEPPPRRRPPAADLEAGSPAARASLATRVADDARAQLAATLRTDALPYPAARAAPPRPPGHRARADAFFWDNGFHSDAPGSPLAEVRRHFRAAATWLGQDVDAAGPLHAAWRVGLAGADKHLLADEAAKARTLAFAPEARRLAGRLRDAIAQTLHAAITTPAENDPDHDLTIRLIAVDVSLAAWIAEADAPATSPAATLDRALHGRPPNSISSPADHARVAEACAAFIARPDPACPNPANTPDIARMIDRVLADLPDARVGAQTLLPLAESLQIDAGDAARTWFRRLQDRLDARDPSPAAQPAPASNRDIGRRVAAFLADVQFGNHVKFSYNTSGGFSARGAGASLPPLPGGDPDVPGAWPLSARADLRGEHAREQVLRAGAATHGGELFLGREHRHRGAIGAGLLAGRSGLGADGLLARIAAAFDVVAHGEDRAAYEGVMFRVARRVVTDDADAREPRFVQNDPQVRATMRDIALMLFDRAARAKDDDARDELLDDLVARFADQGLSLTLLGQHTTTRRSEAALSLGVSARTATHHGQRVGASVGIGAEHGWHTRTQEHDTSGTYRVDNRRVGWFERRRVAADVGVSTSAGLASWPLATAVSANAVVAEGGATVRIRTPTDAGRIVPEKTFCDTETADKALFRRIVLADIEKWSAMFAFPHRHLPPGEASAAGRAAVDAFLHKIEHLREESHVYYARERMHPEVARRLDELALLADLAPTALAGFHAELQARRAALVAADTSWGAASLIAYQRHVVHDGTGLAAAGLRVARTGAVEGEREFIFDTIGWAWLRQRERENPPPLDP